MFGHVLLHPGVVHWSFWVAAAFWYLKIAPLCHQHYADDVGCYGLWVVACADNIIASTMKNRLSWKVHVATASI